MQNFQKKLALITGASSGLGFALSKLLVDDGFHIIGVSKNPGSLQELEKALLVYSNASFDLISADLKDENSVKALSNEFLQKWGYLDLLVHCAAISDNLAPTNILFGKEFENIYKNNVLATKLLICYFDQLLKAARSGKAIFVDDTISGKFLSSYSASKAAARQLVKAYKAENEKLGPKVCLFSPNPMPTKLRARFFPGEMKDVLSSCLSQAKVLKRLI